VLDTLPKLAIQYFETYIFQPDFNFKITSSFFLPTNKQLVPAARAIIAPE
jgi:hypothetical protein